MFLVLAAGLENPASQDAQESAVKMAPAEHVESGGLRVLVVVPASRGKTEVQVVQVAMVNPARDSVALLENRAAQVAMVDQAKVFVDLEDLEDLADLPVELFADLQVVLVDQENQFAVHADQKGLADLLDLKVAMGELFAVLADLAEDLEK